MPDDNTQQNNNQNSNNQDPNAQDSNNQNNNNQNTGSTFSGSGKKIVYGADGGCHPDDVKKIQAGLEACGNEVTFTCIDPNQEAYFQGKGADMGVFFCNGVGAATIWSFNVAIKAGSVPFTVFAFPGWAPYHNMDEPEGTLASLETVRNEPFVPEHDAGQFMNASSTSQMQSDGNGATTLGEFVDANSSNIAVCHGTTLDELVQNICSGACGGGGSSGGSTVGSGGGAQIKDKTFEHCIRRICAATDSIFVVDNNVAVLFPYTDWMAFTLRQKIDTITKKEIDPNVFTMEYNNDGFYNKVSIAWGGVTLPERFKEKDDDNQKTTKEQFMHNNFTIDDITKNITKSGFNFATQLKNNKDNKNNQNATKTITKKDKTTQELSTDETGATILSEQYDSLVEKYGVLEKRVQSNAPDLETAQYIANALLIQYVRDFNNSCRCRTLTSKKYNGGTFHAVQNPFTDDTELFYLNGYSMRIQKKEPIYHDLDFRYGPESAEELADYQTFGGGGGGGTATTTNTGGGSATEEQIWQHASKFCHFWSCGELREAESDTNDPQVAEDYVNKKEKANTPKICLSCYGMSAWLYYQFNYKANIPCQVVGNSGHKVVMIDRGNGFVKTENEYRQLDKGFRWSDQGTNVLLAAPNNTSSVGGNTNGNTGTTNNGNNSGSGNK